MQRSRTERGRGAPVSENADTSSDKPDENSGRRKPKVPGPGSSSQGQSGAKMRS